MATVFWVFVKDYKYFLQRDLGPYRDRKHPRAEWLFLIVGKLAYYVAMIVLPLLVLEITWWQFLIGFLTLHLTAGLILGVVFQLAHVVEATAQLGEDTAGALKGAWMLYQMRTTNNFAPDNRLLSWYVGGLNFQIEHHLFPRVCHALPAAQPDRPAPGGQARHPVPQLPDAPAGDPFALPRAAAARRSRPRARALGGPGARLSRAAPARSGVSPPARERRSVLFAPLQALIASLGGRRSDAKRPRSTARVDARAGGSNRAAMLDSVAANPHLWRRRQSH